MSIAQGFRVRHQISQQVRMSIAQGFRVRHQIGQQVRMSIAQGFGCATKLVNE